MAFTVAERTDRWLQMLRDSGTAEVANGQLLFLDLGGFAPGSSVVAGRA